MTTTLEELYRSFITSGMNSSKIMMDSSRLGVSEGRKSAFEQLVELLYPPTPGALLDAETLYDKMIQISPLLADREPGKSPYKDPEDKGRRILSHMIRIYYADLGRGNKNLEEKIEKFYVGDGKIEGTRPSAYIGYSNTLIDKRNFTRANLSDMLAPLLNGEGERNYGTSLTYILVDTPAIDLKLRRADKAEVFLNYLPPIVASQLVPYMEVEFSMSKTIPDVQTGTQQADVMGPLKFLLGTGDITTETVDRFMYDASLKQQGSGQGPDTVELDKYEDSLLSRRDPAEADRIRNSRRPRPQLQKTKNITTVTTMDTFLMPHTLLNMDYDQNNNPRYNPVLNPTLPFGTIVSANINVTPMVGIMSHKTATLILKIYDRSRMVEIADFINPRLYQATTLWLTYGWRAPASIRTENPSDSVRTYYDFINENMLIREAYGVKNSSMTIEQDGSVTVNLSLFTKGGINVLEASDTLSNRFQEIQDRLSLQLSELMNLSKKLGLQAFADIGKDVRGSTLINAAMSGDLIGLDYTTLATERAALEEALKDRKDEKDVQTFLALLSEVYVGPGQAAAAKGTDASQTLAIIDDEVKAAEALTRDRFSRVRDCKDLFGYTIDVAPGETATGKNLAKFEKNPLKRILENFKSMRGATKTAAAERGVQEEAGPYGTTSFGKIFAYYFSNVARSLAGTGVVDDFQVVFYKLNDFCGNAAGINIAEFPIDMYALEKAYAKRVQEQKGERMSFNLFLEVVRESQFSDMRNQAYGFRDLYEPDPKTGELKAKSGAEAEISKRAINNENKGAAFLLPSIDFYIEVGYRASPGKTVIYDLLEAYNLFAPKFSPNRPKPDDQIRIMRIHIYDKAASPNKKAMRILSSPDGYIEVEDEYVESMIGLDREADGKYTEESMKRLDLVRKIFSDAAEASRQEQNSAKQLDAFEQTVRKKFVEQKIDFKSDFNFKTAYRTISFRDESGAASFEKVKEQISRLVPTIRVGSNGSAVTNVSYTSNQDSRISTIMMLRNPNASKNPSKPNGSAEGDLPLRIVQGALSLTTLGCPMVEYMQQFFVDLNTGTTADNIYNVTGITHNISLSKFESQFKFGFADAYGSYEGAQTFINGTAARLNYLASAVANSGGRKPGGK